MNLQTTESLYSDDSSIFDYYYEGIDQADILTSDLYIPVNKNNDFEWDVCFKSVN